MMGRDTIIFIAFCLFLLLAGMRLQQRLSEQKSEEAAAAEEKDQKHSWRRYYWIVQWVILGGLLVYMLPVLVHHFMGPGPVFTKDFFLRCLIFLFTIYIFMAGIRTFFKHKN